MPVASSSRRTLQRNRRAPSSDGIEEDGPSQVAAHDEVDDDDDADVSQAPNGRGKKVKVKKEPVKRGRRAAASDDDGDGDNDEEDEDEGDREQEEILAAFENMGNQPLEKAQAQKLNGMSQDWAMIRKNTHTVSYGLVRDVAASMAEFTDGEKGEKSLIEIDTIMKKLVDTENKLKAHEDTLNELYQKVVRGEQISDVVDVYAQEVARKLEEYDRKTSRQKYGKHDAYSSFRQAIFEVQHPDEAMPPVTEALPREDGDDSDEEDLQIGGVTQDYKCPLSLTILVNPRTSKLCKHSYSEAAIMDYLKHGPKTCPASGCNKKVSVDVLEEDKELAKKAKDAARRERARDDDDDDDDDEVIE